MTDYNMIPNNHEYMVVFEWELATPHIVGWTTLEEAKECVEGRSKDCKRVTVFKHSCVGLYDEVPELGVTNDSRNS